MPFEEFEIDRGKTLTDAELNQIEPGEYKRYAITADGISPRAIPGHPNAVYTATSDEHTEYGRMEDEDPANQDCPNILQRKDTERFLQVDWGTVEQTFAVPVTVKAYDRQGLMGDISTLLQNEGVNIADVSVNFNRSLADLRLVVEASAISSNSAVYSPASRACQMCWKRNGQNRGNDYRFTIYGDEG